MNLVLLTVDGVLNNKEHTQKLEKRKAKNINNKFDPKSLDLMKQFVDTANCEVYLIEYGDHNWTHIYNQLKSKGINCKIIKGYDESIMKDLCSLYDNHILIDNGEYELNHKYNRLITKTGLVQKDGFRHEHLMSGLKTLLGDIVIEV